MKRLPLYSAILASFACSAPAMSQSSHALLEEVMVVSQKKGIAESVQDIPIAISAFSGDKVEAMHAVTLTDIGLTTPNANLAPIGTIGGVANFVIRGMGTVGASIPSQDPAVGVVIDGVSMGTIFGVVTDLFDLESIEILKGPQGTLFGRNVTGGAVVMRTIRPGDEFEGKVRATVGNFEQKELSVMLAGPLSDEWGGKISVLQKEHGGYWSNRTLGGKHGDQESLIIRPTLTYAKDNFDISLITEYGSMEGDGAGVRTFFADGEQLFKAEDDNFTLQDNTAKNDLEWVSAIVEANWDIYDGTLTAVFGYKEIDQEFGSDLDGFIGDRFRWAPGTGFEQEQLSLEVRWAGQLTDRVSLTAGAYLFDQEYTYSERRLLATILDRRGVSTIDHATQGIFAQSEIDLTDSWTLTLGGRYTRETKDAAIGIIGDPNATGNCATIDLRNEPAGTQFEGKVSLSDCAQPFQDDETWTNFAPKAGLTWDVNENVMAYASFTRGFRSGGYNVRFTSANPLASPGPYDEETVDAFEIGAKSTFMDGNLRLNVALFNNEFDDLQRTVLGSGGAQATLNAADANIHGAEIDFVYAATDNLIFEGAFGWTNASYDSFEAIEQSTGKSADSLNFVMTPETNSSAAVTYAMNLGDNGDIDWRLSYSFTNSTFGNDANTLSLDQYELWDASITYTNADGDLSLSLFGKNLKDEVYFNFGTDFENSVLAVKSKWLTPPRTFGLEATYEF